MLVLIDSLNRQAFFNVLLSEYGVEGVKIQEIFSFDDDVQSMLPQPVYGLIFLYQYFAEKYEDDDTETRDVWFANQVSTIMHDQISHAFNRFL